jgi:hypothetical protein
MSTTPDEAMIEKECWGQRIKKPKVAINYNETMGAVNLNDANLVSYQSARKRLKEYPQKHFRHMMDICCLNSYLLYVKTGGKI